MAENETNFRSGGGWAGDSGSSGSFGYVSIWISFTAEVEKWMNRNIFTWALGWFMKIVFSLKWNFITCCEHRFLFFNCTGNQFSRF